MNEIATTKNSGEGEDIIQNFHIIFFKNVQLSTIYSERNRKRWLIYTRGEQSIETVPQEDQTLDLQDK